MFLLTLEDYGKSVGVTENFNKKFPSFIDLFIHYSPFNINPIEYDDSKCSWEKMEMYFEVDSKYECIKRHYIVNFTLDSKGFLDDAKVKLVGEYPYNLGYKSKAGSQVFYKNSNWDYLKLTDNFRKKFKSEEGVYKDIDKINISISTFGFIEYNGYMIKGYKCIDGNNQWLYEKYYYDSNGYLDDAEILPIDYDGENAEEAKATYIKQYENN